MKTVLKSSAPYNKFAPIIEATKDSIIIANDSSEIVFWNDASTKIFGYGKNEALGKSLKIILPKDRHESYFAELKEFLEEESQDQKATTAEIIGKRSDGSTFPIEISISSWMEENETFIFGIIRDISERKRIEKDNIDLRQIINRSPSCVKLVDKNGLLIDMNTVGLNIIECQKLETMYMSNVYNIIHKDDREKFKKFNQFICSGGEGSLIFRIVGLKGTEKTMETFARPHQLKNGEIGHLAITNDISRRISSEKELFRKDEELEEAKRLSVVGEFAAGIAHEVNNPLAIIHSRCQLLKLEIDNLNIQDEKSLKSINKSIQTINETIEITADLVKNLKIFSGKVDTNFLEIIVVKDAIDMALKIIDKRCESEGIELLVEVDPNIKLMASAAGLAQVLLNLIMNSVDAIKSQEKKWIRMESEVSNRAIKILITDSGNGIPEDIIYKITQPFFSTKEHGKGTGLGLSISLKLINKMKGKLYYNPDSKNTQFVIEFNAYE